MARAAAIAPVTDGKPAGRYPTSAARRWPWPARSRPLRSSARPRRVTMLRAHGRGAGCPARGHRAAGPVAEVAEVPGSDVHVLVSAPGQVDHQDRLPAEPGADLEG